MEDDELAFAGVARQAELVRGEEVSSRELVELCLRRIERLEPELNAFRVVMGERALADARHRLHLGAEPHRPAGARPAGRPGGRRHVHRVQLVGRHGAEDTLLALGAQLEQRLGWPGRRPAVATSA